MIIRKGPVLSTAFPGIASSLPMDKPIVEMTPNNSPTLHRLPSLSTGCECGHCSVACVGGDQPSQLRALSPLMAVSLTDHPKEVTKNSRW